MEPYLDVSMPDKSDKEKAKAFLYLIGQQGREIYRTMEFTTEAKDRTIKELLDKFNGYCNPKENVTVERHKFFMRSQEPNENIDQYATELSSLAATCDFGNLRDSLIKDRIVCGILEHSVKERLLREPDLDLNKALQICRASELSKQQVKSIGSAPSAVHALNKRRVKGYNKSKIVKKEEKPFNRRFNASSNKCGKCGKIHEKNKCPAFGRTCHNCQKKNHFSNVCRSTKKVHEVECESPSSDDEGDTHYLDTVTVVKSVNQVNKNNSNEKYVNVKFGGIKTRLKVDTGAEVSVISADLFRRIVPKKDRHSKLEKTNETLAGYSAAIPTLEKCYLKCERANQEIIEEFFAADLKNAKSILGLRASESLGIVKFNLEVKVNHWANIEESEDLKDQIMKEHPKLFTGLGCISEPYRIRVDETAQPVVHPARKVPATLRGKVKDELNRMVKEKVIAKVNQPTKWVNSRVAAEKKNSNRLRICIDPQNLNAAIQREQNCQLPTIEEITCRLAGAKYFSKVDANSGYWQIPLDEESSYLTTFGTPFDRFRFLRLPFGLNCAQEVYHKRVHEMFDDMEGVETDIDDVLIFGRTNEEHD